MGSNGSKSKKSFSPGKPFGKEAKHDCNVNLNVPSAKKPNINLQYDSTVVKVPPSLSPFVVLYRQGYVYFMNLYFHIGASVLAAIEESVHHLITSVPMPKCIIFSSMNLVIAELRHSVLFFFMEFIIFRSMYFDEDGDLAHEFYVEVKEGRKRKMKRVYNNLTPQVWIFYFN